MNISTDGAFIYFTIPIFGGINITQTTVSHLIVTIFLCVASILLGRNLKKRPGKMQVMVEKGVSMLMNTVSETMGAHNLSWTPFIGTIFLSSLCGSYIGLLGIFRSSTADVSCTLTWAVMVSLITWYLNIKHNGFLGWLKGFTEPIVVMTPMNIVSEIAQPIAMAFRHFGNLAGGGVINSLLYTALSMASVGLLNLITANGWLISAVLIALGIGLLVLWRKKKKVIWMILGIACVLVGICGVLHATGLVRNIPILTYGIPAVLSCYFDIFSGFIQAYVFTLLTMVYIGGVLPEPAEEGQAA